MAVAYGNWMSTGARSAVRAKIEYSVTEYTTYVSVSITAHEQQGYNRGDGTYEVSSDHGSALWLSGTNQAESYRRSATYSWNKTTSAFNVSISGKYSSSSIATATITIPALASWNVAYNSNGGSGTVSTQKKYYGVNLTLASGGFTRTNYSLTRWNTKADGSGTSYPLSGTYSENAAITLYAQWHLDYIKPTVTSSEAFRVASASAQTVSNDGKYIRIKFTYTGGITTDEGASYIQPTCVIKIDGTQVYSGTLNATGTFDNAYGTYTENTSHTVSVLLYDSHDSTGTSFSLVVPSAVFPIDILGDGSAMGLMTPAVAGQKLKLFVDAIYPVGSYYETSNKNFNPNTYFGGTWVLEAAGKVHVGAGTGYTIGATGGEATVKLTYNQAGIKNASAEAAGFGLTAATAFQNRVMVTNSTTTAHNNMPPYIVVNRWHRTA